MRLQPDPKNLVLLTGPRKTRHHLGFVENNKLRPLCGAKISSKNLKYEMVSAKGKMNCRYCRVRYNMIARKIKQLGIEWVCYGQWVDFPKRVFSFELPSQLSV